MAAPALQLQHAVERAVQAGQAAADARARAARLELLKVVPDLEWFVADEWQARHCGERIAVWTVLYRLRIWRLGPPGGPWGWSLETRAGAVLRTDVVRRKRDARRAAEQAAKAAVTSERLQLEREAA
jgi:hypothetical protein